MKQIHKASLALVLGAMAVVLVVPEAQARMLRPPHGQHQAAWHGHHHGRHFPAGGWGWPDDADGVAVVDGTAYGGYPDPAQTLALDREPSFGGWVYRAGRAADGSVYANSYRSYQPYAPPVIIRVR
ncbi:hypothetical protein [Labrys wisconsinensis]|uniref:Uncharacterized protein n=1 Tax=Labrys wisconsinensis TaxID=425677 RepID=A0ABU0J368_9HYPH|nr:hypothetical protein [Labrys wisconsinensis]MDQ0468702.1 hypothetical protein [Labrys wisconsinensis]